MEAESAAGHREHAEDAAQPLGVEDVGRSTAADRAPRLEQQYAVREAMGAGDKQRMEEASAALNDRLLNYAYLL